ncbi:MAG: T9SS type A sorting domain-containing protein [Bacteroidota bacterium]
MIYFRLIVVGYFSLIGMLAYGQNNAIFLGSQGDGYDEICFIVSTNNSIFLGSQGDGYDELCFVQPTNSSIFGGSQGDGYDERCFLPSTNNSIFLGSQGDGFDELCFVQPTNSSIFGGSQGDGFDELCYILPTNNRIFFGSINDGFSQECVVVDPIPLPVELLAFDGTLLNPDEALLHWIVATEINNAFFVLERSLDARTFEEVAIIASLGNTTETREYFYKDDIRSLEGQPVVYYRLQQVDLDESYEYTHVIALNLPTASEQQEYILYPNPAKERVFLRYANAIDEEVQVQLFDHLGRQLWFGRVAALDLAIGYPIDLNHLPEGSYHIRMIDGDQIHVKTFIKAGH